MEICGTDKEETSGSDIHTILVIRYIFVCFGVFIVIIDSKHILYLLPALSFL